MHSLGWREMWSCEVSVIYQVENNIQESLRKTNLVFLCSGPVCSELGHVISPTTEPTSGPSASTTPSPSDGAGGDFREPVQLIEIVGAGPENEFINAHIALVFDRLFHRRARSRQRTKAPRRKIGIVSVVRVYSRGSDQSMCECFQSFSPRKSYFPTLAHHFRR